MEKTVISAIAPGSPIPSIEQPSTEVPINASGHRQELDRNFSLLSSCGIAITSGNTWIAIGGSVVVAIYNGGPPGIIYEFIVASVFYWFIAASIAELASAMPSSGGVYHWASITAGKHGRVCGFFAGWWNFFAWIFGVASTMAILAEQVLLMYSLFHPAFALQKWHVFVVYIIFTWVSCAIVLFANRALPAIESLGGFFILAGCLISIIVCAAMPHVKKTPYATNSFVWRDWSNATGYTSEGFVFCLGMLNGAFTVGTPDVISHLAEEIPRPSMNIPKAILVQYVVGFFTALLYIIAILYGIDDLEAIIKSGSSLPLAMIYLQATGSPSGAVGLLVLAFIPTFIAAVGIYITASRTYWTLSRDKATPFSEFFGKVHPRHKNPFNAIALCGVITTVLGGIYVGSSTAFNAFIGSFVVLSTLSYLAAILPHLLSKRQNVTPGWFWMKGVVGYVVNGISCAFIIAFVIIFCFPFSMPVTAATMNYSCLITGGFSLFVAAFWLWRRNDYIGPRNVLLGTEMLAKDAM